LGTGPTAEYPAKHNRENNDEDHKGQHTNTKNEKVLWPEYHTEKNELTFNNIQHEDRFTVYLNERKCKKNEQVKNAEPGTELIQPAFRLLWVNKVPLAFPVNGGNCVPEGTCYIGFYFLYHEYSSVLFSR
jgi:hypothetical protein